MCFMLQILQPLLSGLELKLKCDVIRRYIISFIILNFSNLTVLPAGTDYYF